MATNAKSSRDGYVDSLKHNPDYIRILWANLDSIGVSNCVSIRPASVEEDQKFATNIVIETTAGNIPTAFRERAMEYKARYPNDVTVRCINGTNRTELEKLSEGNAGIMVYGWSDNVRYDYLIINAKRACQIGILDSNDFHRNNDNKTGFVAVRITDLRNSGCILAEGKTHYFLNGNEWGDDDRINGVR